MNNLKHKKSGEICDSDGHNHSELLALPVVVKGCGTVCTEKCL